MPRVRLEEHEADKEKAERKKEKKKIEKSTATHDSNDLREQKAVSKTVPQL